MTSDLAPFFHPGSVAIVGASARATSSGGAVIHMLQRSGYEGEIIPVNPKGGEMFGLTARLSLAEVSPPAELAVIVLRPDAIPELVRQAGTSGHKNLMILPGGFVESGGAGAARERQVRETAAAHGITIFGPNSAGVISMAKGKPFAPTFLRDLPPGPDKRGALALITQSGALAEEIICKANATGLPLATIVSAGNGMHLGVEDFLDHLGDDPGITAVLLYIESVVDPERLRRVARRVAAEIPVVALFGGASGPGAQAARAHTAAVANDGAAIAAFAEDCCLLRVTSVRELMLAAKGFAFHPQGVGPRALILSNSGGPGVLTTDRAADGGLDLPPLPPAMIQALHAELPAEASIANPLDLLADAREDRFGLALERATSHARDTHDVILGIHVVPYMVDAGPVIARMAALAPLAAAAGLPMLHSMMGTLVERDKWFGEMEDAGVAMFNDSEAMAECASLLARYPPLKARATQAPVGEVAVKGRGE